MIVTHRDNWKATLLDLGFREQAGQYQRDDLLVARQSGWLVLRKNPTLPCPTSCGQLGQPGLWKRRGVPGEPPTCDFEMPLSVCESAVSLSSCDDEPLRPSDSLTGILEWALAAAIGTAPDDWTPPPRVDIEGWLPAGSLTVQSGGLIVQGTLHYAPQRLCWRFPLVGQWPRQLSAARRQWLNALVDNAQEQWRFVRIGACHENEGATVVAEVDLSGAPSTLLEPLARTALDSLRFVVARLLGPLTFLADPGVLCGAWEVSPARMFSAERERS